MTGVQTVGGSGALRVCAELLVSQGITTMLIPDPSWANHKPLLSVPPTPPPPESGGSAPEGRAPNKPSRLLRLQGGGLEIGEYAYFDQVPLFPGPPS